MADASDTVDLDESMHAKPPLLELLLSLLQAPLLREALTVDDLHGSGMTKGFSGVIEEFGGRIAISLTFAPLLTISAHNFFLLKTRYPEAVIL
jgi:hypothetical protein